MTNPALNMLSDLCDIHALFVYEQGNDLLVDRITQSLKVRTQLHKDVDGFFIAFIFRRTWFIPT